MYNAQCINAQCAIDIADSELVKVLGAFRVNFYPTRLLHNAVYVYIYYRAAHAHRSSSQQTSIPHSNLACMATNKAEHTVSQIAHVLDGSR